MTHHAIPVSALHRVGRDLHRPECVLPAANGDVYVPDWRGGVTRIAADGTQETWLAAPGSIELRPNGIALDRDGSFLLANLGDAGGIWRLHRNGAVEPFLAEVEGRALPPANFVTLDGRGRAWISVSTLQAPRQHAWRNDVADGFVVLADGGGARVVADRLQYTNEVRPDPTGEWLYVVETFGRRLTRFRLAEIGMPGDRETVLTLAAGCFPDGFTFAPDGAIWLTCLISNRLLRIAGGEAQTILEDVNPDFVESVENAFIEGRMHAGHLGPIPGTTLQQLSSVAFGGPGGRTLYLGSLHGTCVYRLTVGSDAA
jgi:sugar lactone lactonase YvrE